MTGFRERLEGDVVLGAEGYLFELERRGYLKSGPYVPEVVLDFPTAVRELHGELLRAGAEVMVAFTYYGHREKLRTIGREQDLEPLNRQALRLAKEAAAGGSQLLRVPGARFSKQALEVDKIPPRSTGSLSHPCMSSL